MSEGTMFDNVRNDVAWLENMAKALRKEADRFQARAEKVKSGVAIEEREGAFKCEQVMCTSWYCSCIVCTWI